MSKTAFILAAGLGTRLRPFTELYPKPMISIGKEPLLLKHIRNLYASDFRRIIINTSYLSWKLEGFIQYLLTRYDFSGLRVDVVTEDQILGTGGALINLRKMVEDDSFLIINSDIMVEPDYSEMFASHKQSGAIATLLLYKTEEKELQQVAVADDQTITAIAGLQFSDKPAAGKFLFSGVHIVSRDIFSYLDDGFQCVIRDVYNRAAADNRFFKGIFSKSNWCDIGTLESFRLVHESLLTENSRQEY